MLSYQSACLMQRVIQREMETLVCIFDEVKTVVGNPVEALVRKVDAEDDGAIGEDDRYIMLKDKNGIVNYVVSEEPFSKESEQYIRTLANVIDDYENGLSSSITQTWKETMLVTRLLAEDASMFRNDIISSAAEIGYQVEHPVAVTVVWMELGRNYCLNLDLGYQSATNDAKDSILSSIKSHVFMNRQDIVAFVQNNCLVILKAIEELNDVPTLYQVQSKIADAIDSILRPYRLFHYYIATGGISENFESAFLPYQKAMEYIRFARRTNLDHTVITSDDILYYSIAANLPDEYHVRYIEPKVQVLLKENQEMVDDLIKCFNALADNGFNIALTAETEYLHRNTVKKRIDKLYRFTGFDPMGAFKDILANKLILQQYLIDRRKL